MTTRAFPIAYVRDVEMSAAFYERLGFTRHFQFPEQAPGYIGLRLGSSEMAVVSVDWPKDRYGLEVGPGPVFEMFVYVDDADATWSELESSGATVIAAPADMPWGERVGFVRDPDGNPVAIATAS